jgi:hypothetical protein
LQGLRIWQEDGVLERLAPFQTLPISPAHAKFLYIIQYPKESKKHQKGMKVV